MLTKDPNLAAMDNAQSYLIYAVIDRDGNLAAEQRGAAGESGLRRLSRRAGIEAARIRGMKNRRKEGRFREPAAKSLRT